MKKPTALLATLALLAPAALFAAKADGPKAKLLAQYDTNHNGKLDPDEVEVLRQAFAAEPKGDLARFDTNHDGKLSDEEIAAIVPGAAKKKAEDKTDKKTGEKKKKAGK
jgi:Ca2+-binding EF-hand superfamily protein